MDGWTEGGRERKISGYMNEGIDGWMDRFSLFPLLFSASIYTSAKSSKTKMRHTCIHFNIYSISNPKVNLEIWHKYLLQYVTVTDLKKKCYFLLAFIHLKVKNKI